MLRKLCLTVGACFVIGLAIAPVLPVARASKCSFPSMDLELDAIEGDADPSFEQAFWSPSAGISNHFLSVNRIGEPWPMTVTVERL